jgi:exodeoxyribonuclease VII large subunit
MARAKRSRATSKPQAELFDIEPPSPPRAPRVDPTLAVREPADPYAEVGELFPGASARSAVSVATLAQSARDVLEGAFFPLWVRGEVSDFKAHRNGHWYFCLRDRDALIRCVVWSRDRRKGWLPPDDGTLVVAQGQLTVYPGRGEMQFVVRRIEAEGDGQRRKALEQVHARLTADGLLAPERKRPLPRYPRCIALVTSPNGAALHDVVAVLERRAPSVRLVLIPATVQGGYAPQELCLALDQVSRWGGADTVIIGRGGGAREDLSAFNDERVARAVAACPMPTISAVGHEIDVTICDLVADHRSPTPSAAAEAATVSHDTMRGELRVMSTAIASVMDARLTTAGDSVRSAARELERVSRAGVERRRTSLHALAGRLDGLSPLATLTRGYAVARDAAGNTLGSVAQFARGKQFDLLVRDGLVRASVIDTRTGDPLNGDGAA